MTLTLEPFEITRPGWLAALLVLPLVFLFASRGLTGFSNVRRTVSVACRTLLLLGVILALAGIRYTRPTSEPFVLFAIDQSASIAESGNLNAKTFLETAKKTGRPDQLAILHFGNEPDDRHTNLEAIVQTAKANLPEGFVPRVILLSDGNQTIGDVLNAAESAEIPISVVALTSSADPEVYVDAVHAPGQVQEGEPFAIDVSIHASRASQGTVELLHDNRLIEKRPAKLMTGNNRVRFVQSISGTSLTTFTARLDGFFDTLSSNNRATVPIFLTARPRVLLIENEPLLANHLTAALKDERLDVEVRRADRFPESIDQLNRFELVVLSNVPAAAISQIQMDNLKRYVRDLGGGLVAIGGEQSFTPGGYRHTTLEEILPVWCVFEKKAERPGLAMVLAIDTSLSMEGENIELAKEATRRAVRMLEPKDQIGILAFDETTRWISEIHPCSDKEHILERIDTIRAAGRTDTYPALEKAYLALDEAFAPLKHIVLLSDGVSPPGDFQELADRIAKSRMTVSTVALGAEAVRPLLEDIATTGGGHFHACDDPANIPEIFALETASATKRGIIEGPFTPRVDRATRALEQTDIDSAPSLLGYVETKPKPASQTVLSSESGDPLLIWWRYGLGTSVAFTSDIESRWAAAWIRWPGFPRFWSQLARHAARADEAKDIVFRVQRDADQATVTLDAVDPEGRFVNGAEVTLEVLGPRAMHHSLDFEQQAPGRYACRFPASKPGTYTMETSLRYEGQNVYIRRHGFSVGFAEELRTRPTNDGLLRRIAEVSGGEYNPDPSTLFAPSTQTVPRVTRVWPYFLMAALVLFVIDLAVRRMVLPTRES